MTDQARARRAPGGGPPTLLSAFGNEHYPSLAFGWIALVLFGGVNLFRGSVHLFQSDGGVALILWWWRPLPVDAPGKFGALGVLPVAALAFWAATRKRDRPISRA